MLVATGKTDWVRDVTDQKGSVMEAVGKHGQQLRNGKLMLSASDMPLPCEGDGDEDGDVGREANPGWGGAATTVLLLPSWTVVEGVRPGNVPELLDGVVGKMATNTSPLKKAEVVEPRLDSRAVNGSGNGDEKSVSLSKSQAPLAGPEKIPSQDPDSTATTTSPNGTTTTTESQTPRRKEEETEEGEEEEDQPLTLKRTFTFTHAFRTHPSPHLAVILMCSQKTRDARCGQSAPLLRRELERHLRPLGLYRDVHDARPGGVGIYFISHVGGHKYSANVMVYRRRGIERLAAGAAGATAGLVGASGGASGAGSGTSTPMSARAMDVAVEEEEKEEESSSRDDGAVQGIWLARVRPEDCEGIVKFTVLQGKVVKPDRQLRGGFDREKGLVSW